MKDDKKKTALIIIGIVVAVTVIIVGYKIYDRNKSYSAYKVEYTTKTDENVDSQYCKFGQGIIRYNSDGISYVSGGKEVWNHGFEVRNPVIDVCGDYVAIADEGANEINIYGVDGKTYDVSTSYPVRAVEVSKQGVVAGLLGDDKASYIEVIAKDGTQIAIGRTVLEGDGYPISISLSDDAQKVVASYIAVASGEAKTKVVFYNYSEVGKNETDRIVGGFNDFDGTLVPDVEFVNSNTVAAFGDNMITIYTIDETPSVVKKIKIKKEIKSVVYNDKYICLVEEDNDNIKTSLVVYDMKGDKILDKNISFTYTDIKMAEESVLFYNDTECRMISVKGVEKFRYKFGSGISSLLPLDDMKLVLSGSGNIQQITLN